MICTWVMSKAFPFIEIRCEEMLQNKFKHLKLQLYHRQSKDCSPINILQI